ncbi:MAG: MarR family transcriptional regulator [Desulfovibrio sp.]|jgi:DNA-binding MarR family transcriptional regulator|nr:MarR family transcriptional regulator [Desulfovibrio sp.]
MCNKFYNVENSLGFMTITANRLMGLFLRRRFMAAGIDLTAEQWGVLAQIWNRQSVTQDELARHLCVDKSSLSRVLNTMERKGFVRRDKDPADARRNILCAAPAAEAVKTQALAEVNSAMVRVLEGVAADEHAACLRVLGTIKNNLRENLI